MAEPAYGKVNSEASSILVAAICRGKFWATTEETAAWLETDTGKRIAALIDQERRKRNAGNQRGVESKAARCAAR